MASDDAGSVGYVLSSGSGDLGRSLYDMQRKISAMEQMNSNRFTESSIRLSLAVPSVGIVSFV
jgi:hypothetical protein